jgi:DNA-binding CsgD family transcriptional regulator
MPRQEAIKTNQRGLARHVEAAYGGVHVKVIRRTEQSHDQEPRQLTASGPAPSRETYFFYEKNTGVSHFHVEATSDGQFPVEEAAGLLAMHCMVRGQSPRDYVVMVQATHDALEGLTEKAEKLLQAGHSVGSSVKLTRREEEVLGGVMRSLANKEIAASLNLSERTVKFHVSSLLTKFRVRGRMELVREATRRTPAVLGGQPSLASREARGYPAAPGGYHAAPRVGPIARLRTLTA